MKKYTYRFLFVLCLVAFGLAPLLAQAQTKRQTVNWLNKYGNDVLIKYREEIDKLTFKVGYNGNVIFSTTHIYSGEKDKTINTYSFNLKDLDPSKSKVNNKELFVSCSSTKCIEHIQIQSIIDNKIRSQYSGFSLIHINTQLVDDPMVNSMHKAFIHAIELFGGQTVEKDLFDGN